MATYEQVANAGNLAGQNVYKARFGSEDCSDLPQLQAWDDYEMTTTDVESLAGTDNNGLESQILAAHTTGFDPGAGWATGLASSAGGGAIQGAGNRANRLRGNESYLILGDAGDVAPVADEERKFQLAFALHDDSTPGTSSHRPVVGVKTFYAGAAPTVTIWYNKGTEGTPDWVQMTTAAKGTDMAIGVQNTIHATGPDTTTTSLDPVTKPGSGEAFADEQWIQTAL